MIERFFEILRLGIRNMRGYPLRTFLTALGVVFGVSSVILMRAVGAGAEAELLREMGKLGIDNIIVNSVKPPEKKKESGQEKGWVNTYGLRFKDAEHLRETVPGVKRVLPVHSKTERVWAGSHKVDATIYGVTPEHLTLLGLDVVRGQTLAALHGDRLNRVCIIRPGLFRELGRFDDPLGADLRIGDEFYHVIGLLPDDRLPGYASKALAVDKSKHEIYVPFEMLIKRQGTLQLTFRSGSDERSNVELSQVIVGVTNVDSAVEVARMIAAALERLHEDKDYEIVVPVEYLRQRKKTQDVFNYTFLAIAAISLLVGGIGIANIMLATVTERTREIGVRRALGARHRDIMAQFLAETTLVATAGGIVGVGAGFAFDLALRKLTGWTTIVSPESVALGLGVSVLTGILSGIFPARRAAGLDPITALRHT